MGIRSFLAKKLDFNDKKFLKKQTNIYSILALDRKKALEKLNQILKTEFNREYDENYGMWSEHLIILSALSESYQFTKILEIGTFKGETTLVITKLFPTAKIITVDLPEENLLDSNTYRYEFGNQNQLSKVKKSKIDSSNVNFLRMNSLNLFKLHDKFELIWVDGDHTYPTVISDILNSIRLLDEDGLMLCDDVIKSNLFNYNSSKDTYDLLKFLKMKKVIDFQIIPKRVGTYHRLFRRKYIGIISRCI